MRSSVGVSLATGEPFEMTFPLRGADGVFRMFLTRIVPVHNSEGRVRRWLGTNVDVAEAAGREAALERSATALREREARLLQAYDELESRVIEEVKAREAAQVRLAQAEKLSALGQLAGGIAHDFNNVMQAVSGGASLIGRHAESVDTVKRLSKIVEDAAWRGASVTRRLLAFARRGELRAAPVQILALLYGMREILAHTLGAAVRVELDVAQGLPAVLADGSQLESVVVNLATNARDAMPQGGTITIAATSERIIDNGHVEGLELEHTFVFPLLTPERGSNPQRSRALWNPSSPQRSRAKAPASVFPWRAALPSNQAVRSPSPATRAWEPWRRCGCP